MSTMQIPSDGFDPFSNNGTTLTTEQRIVRAKRKGLCYRCGIATHKVKFAGQRMPLTDQNVHNGHCIKCDPDTVPEKICVEWERRNPDQIAAAKRTAKHPLRGVQRDQKGTRRSIRQQQNSSHHTPARQSSKASKASSQASEEGNCRVMGPDSSPAREEQTPLGHERKPASPDSSRPQLRAPQPPEGAEAEEGVIVMEEHEDTPAVRAPRYGAIQVEEEEDTPPWGEINVEEAEDTPILRCNNALAIMNSISSEEDNDDHNWAAVGETWLREQPQQTSPTESERRVPVDPDAHWFDDTVGYDPYSPTLQHQHQSLLPENIPSHQGDDVAHAAEIPLASGPIFKPDELQIEMAVAKAVVLGPASELGPEPDGGAIDIHQTPSLDPPDQNELEQERAGRSIGQTGSLDPPDQASLDRPPEAGFGSILVPLNNQTSPTRSEDGPDQTHWPEPWPLNRCAEEGTAADVNDTEGDDEHQQDWHQQDDHETTVSDVSSLHFSTAEDGHQRGMIRQMSSASIQFSMLRERPGSVAESSLQRSAEKLDGSFQALSMIDASIGSGTSHSLLNSSLNNSGSQLQGSKAVSASNSLMAEMLQSGNLLTWMQDFAEEAHSSEEFRSEVATKGGIVAVISAMKTNKNDAGIQQQGCWALQSLSEEYGGDIAKQGGVQCLLSALKHHGLTDPRLQEYATGALANVVATDSLKAGVARKGGVGHVLGGMQAHINHLALQRPSCLVLLRLSTHKECLEALANPQSKGISTVVEAMKRHGGNLVLQQYGTGILKNIAHKESARPAIIKAGGAKTVVAAINRFVGSASLQEQTCWTLFEISSNHDISSSGAIGAVLSAMEAHKQNATIQQTGCGLLRNLSVTKENIYSVSKMKGISTILGAMDNHLENAELQRFACGALKHLSLSGTNEASIGSQGGIQVVIKVMKEHKKDGTVQREACGLLRNVSLNDSNKSLIAQHGGVVCLLVAMKHNTHDAGLQQKALGALLNLSVHTELRRAIASYGGVIATVTIMKNLVGDSKVQQYGSGVLRNMGVSNELKKVIAQNGGIPCILSAMKKHHGDAKLNSYAISALKNLAGDAENKQEIAKLKGAISVISAMKSHLPDSSVQQEGCAILLSLSTVEENSTTIGKQGGIHAIVSAMKSHQKNSSVQSSACAALWSLSASAANQAVIYKQTGIPLIIAGMKGMITVPSVQHKALLALTNMASSDAYRATIAKHGAIATCIDSMKCHVRDAHVQKYGCRFLAAMVQSIQCKPEVRNGSSAVRVAIQYHSDNADVKKYAQKVIVAISFDDETGESRSTKYRDITSIEV